LPGLVAALSDRYGAIRHVMLNNGTWKGEFRRLAIGSAVVRIGWFASLDPALLVATTVAGDQLDILVVPPGTAAEVAELAMTAAADPSDRRRAPERLADLMRPAAGRLADRDESAIWDNEGGRVSTSRAQRPQARVNTRTAFG
jgi:hypothetical protein